MANKNMGSNELIELVREKGRKFVAPNFQRKAATYVEVSEDSVREREADFPALRTWMNDIRGHLADFGNISLEGLADLGICICFLESYLQKRQELFESFGIEAIGKAYNDGFDPAFIYSSVAGIARLSPKCPLEKKEIKTLYERALKLADHESPLYQSILEGIRILEQEEID